jgi:hypothetical protein
VDEKDLAGAIAFVEKLGVEYQQKAYQALYEDVRHKAHTEMPEMFLLQKSMILADEGETMKQVDEDCDKIVDRIVEGVRVEDYELSTEIVQTCGGSILEEKMASIVEKVHLAGTLEDTLLLIKFSQKLPQISMSCALIQELFKVLKAKNLLVSKHGIHLWAHALNVKGSKTNLDISNQETCALTCNELIKNKEIYFKIYQGYVENPDRQKIITLQESNWQLLFIMPEFVDFYYDGDLDKACFLLSTAINISLYSSRFQILNSLYKKMSHFNQLDTFEAFRIFVWVKHNLSSSPINASIKQKFYELQAKAPPCLQLLLWPEPAGATFRLVNKFFNSPLFSTDSNIFCWLPADQKEDQPWSAQVDLKTSLVNFTRKGGNLNTLVSEGTLCLAHELSPKWKVKAVDEHHVKIFSNDGNFPSELTK